SPATARSSISPSASTWRRRWRRVRLLRRMDKRLHIEPRTAMTRAIKHVDAERQVVGGERPGTQHVEIFGTDAVPIGLDGAGVRELPHLDERASVAKHLYYLGAGRRMAGAIHHEVRAKPAHDLPYPGDPFPGARDLIDVHRRFRAELAGQSQTRVFRRAHANHSAGTHLL